MKRLLLMTWMDAIKVLKLPLVQRALALWFSGPVFFVIYLLTENVPATLLDNLPRHQALDTAAELLMSTGKIGTTILLAWLVGGEFTADTFKMVVPRLTVRPVALVSKWLAWLLLCGAGCMLTLLWWGGLGALGCAVAGIPFVDEAAGDTVMLATLKTSVAVLNMLYLGNLALLGATVLRSSMGGFVCGLFLPSILFLWGSESPAVRPWLPGTHVTNLAFHVAHAPATPVELEGVTASPSLSVLYLVGLSVVCLMVAAGLFSRRDLAGS